MAGIQSQFAPFRTYKFGPYELDSAGELRKFGVPIRLQNKPFQLLLALVERPGAIVSRADLQEKLWPGTFVDFEQNLNIAIKKVRDALCDSADEPKFVQTIAGQGYRFIAAVEVVAPLQTPVPSSGQTTAIQPSAVSRHAWRPGWRFAIITVLVLLVVLLVGWKLRQPRLVFEPHDYVLIGDFENRTGDPLLDGAVEAALGRELSNSGYISVAPSSRVNDALALMSKPASTRLDVQTAREVCLRDGGIGALLIGRLQKSGNTYEISAFVVNPADGRTVFAASGTARGQEQLLASMHRVADSVRRRLGEDPAAIRASAEKLERVTTPSLEALRLYSMGERAAESRQWSEAEQLFRRAVARDPEFPSALNMLGWAVYHNQRSSTGNPALPGPRRDEYLALTEHANRLADKATEREANFIRGTYFAFRGDLENAAAAFKAVINVYPDDYWAAGNVLIVEGWRDHWDEARIWLYHAAEIAPNSVGINSRARGTAINRGEEDIAQRCEARLRKLEQAKALPPAISAQLMLEPALRRASAGDAEGAIAETKRMLAGASGPNRKWIAMRAVFLFAALGRFADAEQWAHADGLEPIDRDFAEQRIAVERGDVKGLLEITGRIRHDFPDRPDAPLYAAGDLAHLGLSAEARNFTRRVPHYMQRDSGPDAAVEAEILSGEGHFKQAIPMLQNELRHEYAAGVRTSVFFTAEALARAFDADGDTAEAISVLEPLEYDPRFDFAVASGPTAARLLLAKLYRKAGRVGDAHKVEAELLSFRSVADPDDPLLRELKRQAAQ